MGARQFKRLRKLATKLGIVHEQNQAIEIDGSVRNQGVKAAYKILKRGGDPTEDVKIGAYPSPKEIKNHIKKKRQVEVTVERSYMTRRVQRRFMQKYFDQWKKDNQVSGKDFRGQNLKQKIDSIGGIK